MVAEKGGVAEAEVVQNRQFIYYGYYVCITFNIMLSIKCAPARENHVTHTVPNEFAAMVPQNSKPAKLTQSHLNATRPHHVTRHFGAKNEGIYSDHCFKHV